eukprot:6163332-Amphidinium_carterae.1
METTLDESCADMLAAPTPNRCAATEAKSSSHPVWRRQRELTQKGAGTNSKGRRQHQARPRKSQDMGISGQEVA